MVKNASAHIGDARDMDSVPGSRRAPGGGNGNGKPCQFSCLGNPMDRGAWRATVHGVAKSQTQLSTHKHNISRGPTEATSVFLPGSPTYSEQVTYSLSSLISTSYSSGQEGM